MVNDKVACLHYRKMLNRANGEIMTTAQQTVVPEHL